MDILKQLADTFLDWEAMGEVIPKMFAVGLPNTLVLAIISGIIGTVLGMAVFTLLARAGWSVLRLERWARYEGAVLGLALIAIGLLVVMHQH